MIVEPLACMTVTLLHYIMHAHAQLDNFCAQSECFGYAAYMCIKDSRPREYKSAHCVIS